MASAIDVRGLRVLRGGKLVLRGVSLSVARGRVTGLLGPSGCGKTTLMRSIVGVQRIEAGEVSVLGEPAGTPSLRPRVGYVTQAPSVYGDLSVEENLLYFARVLGAPRERIDAALETVGLGEQRGQVVSTLSGGEQARVSLATALLNRPPVLVLDEPTVGLDPVLRRDLWTAFQALAAEGATLLVSSPKAGETLKGRVSVQWTASDPDAGQTLVVNVTFTGTKVMFQPTVLFGLDALLSIFFSSNVSS